MRWLPLGFAALLLIGIEPAQSQAATASSKRQVIAGHMLPQFSHAPLVGHLAPTTRLSLVIGLPVCAPAALIELADAVSNPSNSLYGHYLTPQQFRDRFSPTIGDYATVVAFARAHGLTVVGSHANRIAIDVTGSAQTVETTFHVSMQRRKRSDGTTFFAPDREPSIDLPVPVLHIGGLDNYQPARPVIPSGGSGFFGTMAGSDFQKAYAPGTTLTGAGQSVALFELDGFYPNDPIAYENRFTHTNPTIEVISSTGVPLPPGTGNIEVAMDIELAVAMAPGLSAVYVYEAPNGASGAPADSVLANIASPPTGVPLSRQVDASWSYPVDATTTQLVTEMAVQGQSFFNSAGDSGAIYCGVNTPLSSYANLVLPYVTFVGQTELLVNPNAGAWLSETALSESSGGVLCGVSIPFYQTGVANNQNFGDNRFRNVPDVAMAGGNGSTYSCCSIIYNNGIIAGNGGGSSAASALWTGFMALINEKRAKQSQPPVGFANPLLYNLAEYPPDYASDFHDMIGGTNYLPGTSGQGYPAVAGYDLVTGWGTPAGLLANFPMPTPSPNPHVAQCARLVDNVYATIASRIRATSKQWAPTFTQLEACFADGGLSQANYTAVVSAIDLDIKYGPFGPTPPPTR